MAVKLGCTLRHVNRMMKGCQESGKSYFSHGNKGREPASALGGEDKEKILLLRENKYHDAKYAATMFLYFFTLF